MAAGQVCSGEESCREVRRDLKAEMGENMVNLGGYEENYHRVLLDIAKCYVDTEVRLSQNHDSDTHDAELEARCGAERPHI